MAEVIDAPATESSPSPKNWPPPLPALSPLLRPTEHEIASESLPEPHRQPAVVRMRAGSGIQRNAAVELNLKVFLRLDGIVPLQTVRRQWRRGIWPTPRRLSWPPG